MGAADKGARQRRGGRAGRAWKALEADPGTHHGRGRAGPDPRGLRASRTSGPGTRAHGAHDQGPRWPATTSEGAPGTGAVRGTARADHSEREAVGLTGGCGSADRQARERGFRKTRSGTAAAGDAPLRGRRGRTTAASGGSPAPTNAEREGGDRILPTRSEGEVGANQRGARGGAGANQHGVEKCAEKH